MLRLCCVVTILAVSAFGQSGASDTPDFPKNDEIKLLITQTERAVQRYEATLALEEAKFGDSKGALSKDRDVLASANLLISALRQNPQAFNTVLGFHLVTVLDDASRNATLCAASAIAVSSATAVTNGPSASGFSTTLAQSCLDVSGLLYTVTESAAALYTRYLEAEEALNHKAVSTAERCMSVLKKRKTKD